MERPRPRNSTIKLPSNLSVACYKGVAEKFPGEGQQKNKTEK